MQKVTVLGAGVLGSQIAFQSAYFGKDVVIYDVSADALAKLDARWEYLKPQYQQDLEDATDERLAATVARLRASADLADAVADADLIIEAVPEILAVKRETWAKVAQVAPDKTVFTTNTSTLLPSAIADATGRPDKFLALHFANQVWKHNTGEVMGHAGTDSRYVDEVLAYAEEIGLVGIRLDKEQPAYILNTLLVAFLEAASKLLVRGVSTPEQIDLTWRTATGAPSGPFEIFDVIGMNTASTISKQSSDPEIRAFAEYVERELMSKGRLGRATGAGFYEYA